MTDWQAYATRAQMRIWREIEELMQLACFTIEEQEEVEVYLCRAHEVSAPWEIDIPTLVTARDRLATTPPEERRAKTLHNVRRMARQQTRR